MDPSGDKKPPALAHVLGPAFSLCLSSLTTVSQVVLLGPWAKKREWSHPDLREPSSQLLLCIFLSQGSWCVTFRTKGKNVFSPSETADFSLTPRDSAEWGKGGPVGGMRHEAVVMRL